MFAGDETKEVEIPHEPDNFFTFRNLSGPELDEADVAGTRKAAEQMKVLPDSVVNQAMAKDSGKEAERDEFRGYDQVTLVKYGVQSWRGSKCDATSCDDEAKARLDARTLAWAARIVFEMNVRPEGEGEGSGRKSSTEREPSLQS
jgi:hypothetical protein